MRKSSDRPWLWSMMTLMMVMVMVMMMIVVGFMHFRLWTIPFSSQLGVDTLT
jgi:hypothetical protein